MLRTGEDFGVRIYPSGIELPQNLTTNNKIYYPYAPLDSIMKLRTLTKADSIKYKKQIGIFEDFNKAKNKDIAPSNKLDSVRFFKTPMNKPSTAK
jgi:hypothetical protein